MGIRPPMKFTILRFYHRDLVSQEIAGSWRIVDINRRSRSSAVLHDVAIETHEREPLAILKGALALQSNDDVGGKCATFRSSIDRQLADQFINCPVDSDSRLAPVLIVAVLP